MSEIKISSTGWLAISLRNGTTGVFDLNDTCSWQSLNTQPIVNQSKDDDDLNCSLIKFSPNGQILVINRQNKQLDVYIQSDFEQTETWWQLERIILVKNCPSSLDLTNQFLFIADKIGDVYKVDLSSNDKKKNLIITAENCVMKNISMLFNITFIRINDTKSYLITTDQENRIRLSHYPNTSKIEGDCIGHTECVSHIKLIDNNHLLSASGDGTLRLWSLPNCVPLVLLHSKVFTLLSKQIFYTELYNSENLGLLKNYQRDSMPQESSTMNYCIWKMDIASSNSVNSDTFIAFSIYTHRFHSIYLTSLSNIKELANEQRKLTFDISYGTIVDYCFPSKEILFNDYVTNSKCYLYILFNSNILLKVDIISILLSNKTELFQQSDETIQEINNILTQREFHLIDYTNNYHGLDEIIFKNSNNNICQKRKTENFEQEQRKKQTSLQTEEDTISVENV